MVKVSFACLIVYCTSPKTAVICSVPGSYRADLGCQVEDPWVFAWDLHVGLGIERRRFKDIEVL